MVDYRDLATVRQVAAEAPFITEPTLRWWIFHAETNGLKPALLVNRRRNGTPDRRAKGTPLRQSVKRHRPCHCGAGGGAVAGPMAAVPVGVG